MAEASRCLTLRQINIIRALASRELSSANLRKLFDRSARQAFHLHRSHRKRQHHQQHGTQQAEPAHRGCDHDEDDAKRRERLKT